jgi:hypothetical protein
MKALLYTVFGLAMFWIGLNQIEYGRNREAVSCFVAIGVAYAFYAIDKDE